MRILSKVENNLDIFLVKRLPRLPFGLKELIIKLLPLLSLIEVVFLVWFLIASVVLGGVTFFQTFHRMAINTGDHGFLKLCFTAVSMYTPLLTIPVILLNIYGLVKRKLVSWRIFWWLFVINLTISSILFRDFMFLVYGLIVSYILFQIKEFYK